MNNGCYFLVLKMLLKVMKPFVKIALVESLIEAIMGVVGEEEETTAEETPEETTV